MYVYENFSFLLGKYLEGGLLHHIESIYLTLQETAKLFSTVDVTFCIPVSNVQMF